MAGVGSVRVSFIDSASQLASWYAQTAHDEWERYEAEEFIDGELYHVNAVVRGGQVLVSGAALYLPGMANIDFRSGTPLTTVMVEDPALKARLDAYSARVLAVLGLEDGVSHLECFVDRADRIVLCEVGARPPGGGVIHMLEAQYGVQYSYANLMLAAGRGDELVIPAPTPHRYFGLMGFRLPHNCTIGKIAETISLRTTSSCTPKSTAARAASCGRPRIAPTTSGCWCLPATATPTSTPSANACRPASTPGSSWPDERARAPRPGRAGRRRRRGRPLACAAGAG